MKGLEVLSSAAMSVEKTGLVRSVFLLPKDLLKAATNLYDQGYFLEDLSVLDTKDGFMVVYHFDHYTSPGRVALRVLVPHDTPEIPSISSVFSGADWHERESHDFFGVVFTGHPNLVPLLLPDDADFHPLVKEESARKPIVELMHPGDVEQSTPGIEALFARSEAEGSGGGGTEKPAQGTEAGGE